MLEIGKSIFQGAGIRSIFLITSCIYYLYVFTILNFLIKLPARSLLIR